MAVSLYPIRSLIGVFAMLVIGCTSTPTTIDVSRYSETKSWPLTERPASATLSSDGAYLLLTYAKGPQGNDRQVHEFALDSGAQRVIDIEDNFSRGSVTIPIRTTGKAGKTLFLDEADTFLAHWPAVLVKVKAATGDVLEHANLGNASNGSMTDFNVMKLTPDGGAMFGVGSELVRVELGDAGLKVARDLPIGGGRTIAVLSDTRAATSSSSGELAIGEVGADSPLCDTMTGGIPTKLSASPDGSMIAGAVSNRDTRETEIVIWSSADCNELGRWPARVRLVNDVHWLPDSQTVASAGWGKVHFWDAYNGSLIHVLVTNEEKPLLMLLSRDGRRLVTLSPWSDKEVRLFELL